MFFGSRGERRRNPNRAHCHILAAHCAPAINSLDRESASSPRLGFRDELSVLPAVLVLLSPRTPLDFLHEFHFLARSPSCGLALSPTGGSQTAESRQFSVVRPRPRESDANPVGER
jgi:hypothetical protein